MSAPMILSWCPGSKCDPCACFAEPASPYQTSFNPFREIDFNFGLLPLNPCPFIWPFVRRTKIDFLTGNTLGYFPLGLALPGAIPINPPPALGWYDTVDRVNLSYLGSSIFTCTVTYEFSGDNGAGGWSQTYISGSPAPNDPFQIQYELAQSLAAQVGLTINQFFGDYIQDDPIHNSPIKLAGFIYRGSLDEKQDKILQATGKRLQGPPEFRFQFEPYPIYYGPLPADRTT